MNFRADINGLRFLAVSMVVLFHFKFSFFYGGYAGVDVFFVISGFLMSKIFLKTFEKHDSKGILYFYRDRFYRIYPALICSILLAALFIAFFEPPSVLREFGKEALSSSVFLSNVFYWRSSGYFDVASDLRWLLHTWSLSVEWQFYIIFPIIVYILKTTFKTDRLLTAYISMAAVSFIICVSLTNSFPSLAFYNLPTRAWELFVGAAVSLIPRSHSFKSLRAMEIIGIAALVLFTALAKEASSWPGYWTLVPVLATALVIYANIDNQKSLLRFKPFQLIGNISYSLYLYHWLIVSYMANHAIPFNATNQAIGILASIVLGYGSYRYLERWTSQKVKVTFAVLVPAACVIGVLVSVGFIKNITSERDMHLDKYLSYTNTDKFTSQFGHGCYISNRNSSFNDFDKSVCLGSTEGKKNILLIGDSHAAQLSQSIREKFPEFNIMQATASGCLPFNETEGADRCVDMMKYIYTDFFKNEKPDMVIITADWTKKPILHIQKGIINSLSEMSVNPSDVYIIGQTRRFPIHFYRLAQISSAADLSTHTSSESIEYNSQLNAHAIANKFSYIDVFNVGCISATCSLIDESGIPFMFDDNHLTKEWADKQVDLMRSHILKTSYQ